MEIFFSHSHEDSAVADALQELIEAVFSDVNIERSSDQSQGGGISPGKAWLDWITEHITKADKTYVLLTPHSMRNPWVLWEAGLAAGLTLGPEQSREVVPIIFGIPLKDVPHPFIHLQWVHGDVKIPGGILRVLQRLNQQSSRSYRPASFRNKVSKLLPGYLKKVKAELRDSSGVGLLSSVPSSFSAKQLEGFWVTYYEFKSGGKILIHADIAKLNAESDRRATVRNRVPIPRTEKHRKPFCNEIEAEVANRHLIGQWRNVSDTRYFGGIHLAVLTGENVMEGHYTSFTTDISVGCGLWKWVRIDPATIKGVDLSQVVLRHPREIKKVLARQSKDTNLVGLDVIVEH